MAFTQKTLFVLLVAGLALPAISQAAAVRKVAPKRSDFTYLGSFTTKVAIHGGMRPSTSQYYISHNNAEYETANNDCKDLFGQESGLVNLETQEEFNNVTDEIDRRGDGATLYVTGGKYDTASKQWVWSNGVPVGPWAPWEGGKAPTGTRMSRVALRNVNGYEFRSQFNTVAARYICEIKSEDEGAPTDPEPCYDDNDLVIAVDSSGSIKKERYEIALEFASKLAYTWADSTGNRVSVVIYSNVAELLFPLNNQLSQQEIRDKTHGARFINSGTASNLALDLARKQIVDNPRSVPKNIVFMTDGGCDKDKKTLLQTAITNVKSLGIRTISVGFGTDIVQSELLQIAQDVQKHVFTIDQFEELLTLLRSVSRAVCAKE